jgi:hypothetical protein
MWGLAHCPDRRLRELSVLLQVECHEVSTQPPPRKHLLTYLLQSLEAFPLAMFPITTEFDSHQISECGSRCGVIALTAHALAFSG